MSWTQRWRDNSKCREGLEIHQKSQNSSQLTIYELYFWNFLSKLSNLDWLQVTEIRESKAKDKEVSTVFLHHHRQLQNIF